jgi:hypothetical protein
MQDIIAALISFFLIDPLQAQMSERLKEARVPPAFVSEIGSCARTATPVIVDRAWSDPWWAVSTAAGIWMGQTRPEAALAQAAPACAPAIGKARPFLRGETAA